MSSMLAQSQAIDSTPRGHSRRAFARSGRGFFAIGIVGGKTPDNLGTLWRHARLYGASFVFTVGKRYQGHPTDTSNTPKHLPLFHFADLDDLRTHLPFDCPLVGVELDPRAVPLRSFAHLERACYLLGAEDRGLTVEQRDVCHYLVQIESACPQSMNVAVAGTLLMYDRHVKAAPLGEVAGRVAM